MADDAGKKKIIIDEDWKSRVEAEREELADSQQAAPAADDGLQPGPVPPASLEMLLSTLATEAMICLGQIPHPATGKQEVHLEQAKYFVDMLDVLRAKTSGNLAPDEDAALERLLHELRLAYVEIERRSAASETIIQPPPAT